MKAAIEGYLKLIEPMIVKAIEGQIAKYPNQENSPEQWVKIVKDELDEAVRANMSSYPTRHISIPGETIEAIGCLIHMLMDYYDFEALKQIVSQISAERNKK